MRHDPDLARTARPLSSPTPVDYGTAHEALTAIGVIAAIAAILLVVVRGLPLLAQSW